MKPYLFFISVLLLASSFSLAQTGKGSVSGILKDSTGATIPFASIYLENTSYGTATDADGKFKIANIPEGEYTLVIFIIGYETKRKKISIASGKNYTIEVTLRESINELEEVQIIIKSKNEEIMEQGYSVTVIDAKALQNRNMNVNKALNQSSGVRVRQDAGLGSTFNLTMNGLKGAQFINGVPIEVFGTAYGLNNVPINLVDRVEVYKGVVPASLGGDALGGAINVVTKVKFNNSVNVSYSFGSFNTHRGSLIGTYRDSATGFTAILSGYLNYSVNNYMMKNMEILESSYYVKKNVRRFNDRYFSYSGRLETGLTGKKYADALLVGFGCAGIQKDIQTGPIQYPAARDATGKEKDYQASINYRKNGLIKDRLDVNLFLLLNKSNAVFTDTSSGTYQWDGSILSQRPYTSSIGELGDKQIYKTDQTDIVHRYIVSYRLHSLHTLFLNYTSTVSKRKSGDDWAKAHNLSENATASQYAKSIAALGYDSKLFSRRIQNSLFIKMYSVNAEIDNGLSWENGYFRSHGLETGKIYWGGGLGSSFAISNRVLVKASLERAYRIPTVQEQLGDGINTVANTNLVPESSMNYNIGYSIKCLDKSSVSLLWLGTGFYRDANDFIRAIPGGRRVVYTNFSKVLIRGVESEVKVNLKKKLLVSINVTWQQVLDNNRYVGKTKIDNYTYRQQLPNTPHLFGNIDISYTCVKVFKNIHIAPYFSLLYVNEFYLGFANVAKGADKYIIPTQLTQDIGITFSNPDKPYTLTLECANITNALAYDNFRLQKPGRSYSIKMNFNLIK